jgi:hypothetical protein
MINFNTIVFKRLITHTIYAKKSGQEMAAVEFDDRVTPITPDVEDIIKERLTKACGKRSKAFNLDIADFSEGSFFDFAKQLSTADEEHFIELSRQIATLLANAQRRGNILGGYLLVIDAANTEGKPLVIVIKAEPHDVVSNRRTGRASTLERVKQVILSPSDKLFKIAILYTRENAGKVYPNNSYTGLLFDHQFRSSNKPAEYFWKDFLGFSMEEDGKVQTKRFYDAVYTFIKEQYPTDFGQQLMLIENLHTYLLQQPGSLIDATEFRDTYIEAIHADAFDRMISNEFPHALVKDTGLIEGKLKKRNISFSSDIHLTGPVASFDSSIILVTDPEQLRNLMLDEEYSILVIKGKPIPR